MINRCRRKLLVWLCGTLRTEKVVRILGLIWKRLIWKFLVMKVIGWKRLVRKGLRYVVILEAIIVIKI
jgi:hypothetical protein